MTKDDIATRLEIVQNKIERVKNILEDLQPHVDSMTVNTCNECTIVYNCLKTAEVHINAAIRNNKEGDTNEEEQD
jgi:hypothetical protein